MPYNNISFLKEAMKEDRSAGIWDGYDRLGISILLSDLKEEHKGDRSYYNRMECWHNKNRGKKGK